jgi:D-alanine-D-alanine ligase
MNDEAPSHLKALINDVAIIYCTSLAYNEARKIERLADQEIIEVAYAIKTGLEAHGYRIELVDLKPMEIASLKKFDWVFNLVETINGYPLADFEVTEQLELFGIPFTGSTSKTLKTCLNKSITKVELANNNIPTPDFVVVEPGYSHPPALKFPVIVKPIQEDGCVGINKDSQVWNDQDLEKQIRHVHEVYQQAALVEEFIEGRDITASILGNGEDAAVLPLSEIIYTNRSGPRHLTFDSNWVSESSEFASSNSQCPSLLDLKVEKRIKELALQSFHVMGCRDYTRVDFRLCNEMPFVLEVNPNPCINPDGAGFVNSARIAGYSYSDLVSRILEQAVESRQALREKQTEKMLL